MRPYQKNITIFGAKIKFDIKRENAAFVDNPFETSRIINELVNSPRFSNPKKGDEFKLFDINGNTVGKAVVTGLL